MKQNQFARLEQAREHIGKSYNAISKELDLKTPQVFYDIKAGKSSVSYELARAIQDKFLISSGWLLTGEGDMLGGHDPRTEPTEFSLDKLEKARALADELGVELIPMYSEPFRAGNDGYPLAETMNEVESVWTLPDVRADMIVPVMGDSMAPTFPQGARLAVSRVFFRPDEPLSIPFGEAFAIVLHDPDDPSEYVTAYVKRLYKHEDPAKRREYWIARSDNDRYEDFEVPISHVVGLWRVRASIVHFA